MADRKTAKTLRAKDPEEFTDDTGLRWIWIQNIPKRYGVSIPYYKARVKKVVLTWKAARPHRPKQTRSAQMASGSLANSSPL